MVKAKEGRRESIARWITPASSLVGVKSLKLQPQSTWRKRSPLTSDSHRFSRMFEDVLKQTRLNVGFTTADFEFLANLKGEVQNPLRKARRRHPRAVPDPSPLPLVDKDDGAVGP